MSVLFTGWSLSVLHCWAAEVGGGGKRCLRIPARNDEPGFLYLGASEAFVKGMKIASAMCDTAGSSVCVCVWRRGVVWVGRVSVVLNCKWTLSIPCFKLHISAVTLSLTWDWGRIKNKKKHWTSSTTNELIASVKSKFVWEHRELLE